MLAVSPGHITMLLLTALAMAGAALKRTPRRDDPASRPVVSSPAARLSRPPRERPYARPRTGGARGDAAPGEAPAPAGAGAGAPGAQAATLSTSTTCPQRAADDLEPIAVAGGVEAGVATGSGVAGGTVGSVGPMASDDRPRAMPVPAPDNATPAFPPDADPAITDARVTLRVSIGRDGSVTAVQALSGAAPFTTAALAAARSWQFQPATLAGSPMATTIDMVVAFRR